MIVNHLVGVNKMVRKELIMRRPIFCNRCKRGNCGDGEWVKPFLWSHNSFLRKTNENIKKYGAMEKVSACPKCIKEIKRKEGKK